MKTQSTAITNKSKENITALKNAAKKQITKAKEENGIPCREVKKLHQGTL